MWRPARPRLDSDVTPCEVSARENCFHREIQRQQEADYREENFRQDTW